MPTTGTSKLMKRLAATASVLALAASLAACSSGNEAKQGAGTPTPTKTASATTEAQAKASLIAVADLPAGFKADEYSHEDLPAGCPAVEAATKADLALKPTFVGSSFSKDDLGFSVDSEVGVYATSADAMAVFDAYIKAFATCPTWTVAEDGFSGTIGVKVDSSLQLGDIAAALTLSGEAGGQKFGGMEYVVVVGNTIAFATESGLEGNSDDPQIDLAALAAGMVTKLKVA